MKKNDMLIVLVILIVSGMALGIIKYREFQIKKNSNAVYAHIYVKNQLYKVVTISDNHSEKIVIDSDLGENMVYVHDNGVEVLEADCDDHICEKTGFKSKVGEIIVCLPNKVVVEIKGKQEAKIDEVSK